VLEVGNLVLQNPPKRKPPKATMKPYSDSSNMIQKSIRRNFLSYINSRLSATPEGQGNEVLLFLLRRVSPLSPVCRQDSAVAGESKAVIKTAAIDKRRTLNKREMMSKGERNIKMVKS